MDERCPKCQSPVVAESLHCAACGAELDPYRTILPPRPSAPPVDAPRPPRKVKRPLHQPPSDEVPAAAPPPRPRSAPKPAPPPRSEPPPPRPEPAPPPAPAPAPASSLDYRPAPPPPPPSPPPPAHEPAGASSPGWLRSKLIRMLGGQAEGSAPPPAPEPHPAPAPPASYPPYPVGPQAPSGSWPPPGYPGSMWPQPPGAPPMAPGPYAAPFAPPQGGPPPPAMPPAGFQAPPGFESGSGEDDGMTRMMGGADLDRLRVPAALYILQILDSHGRWHPWSIVSANGLKLGRKERTAQFPELSSMAANHLRLGFEGRQLVASDIESINGVYIKVTAPVALSDGQRFRVGARVIEFRAGAPEPAVEPRRSPDGETFWSLDLASPAYLDFLRPDGQVGVRVPLLKPEGVVLGRESRPGKPVDIALPEDEIVSGQHARVRPEGGTYVLEDLGSRNGTFVQIRGAQPVRPGDILLVGRVLLRIEAQTGVS
jgi:hypothetical protein